jgi:hypothetical protein
MWSKCVSIIKQYSALPASNENKGIEMSYYLPNKPCRVDYFYEEGHKLSKNLWATSKFKVPKEWYEESSILFRTDDLNILSPRRPGNRDLCLPAFKNWSFFSLSRNVLSVVDVICRTVYIIVFTTGNHRFLSKFTHIHSAVHTVPPTFFQTYFNIAFTSKVRYLLS